MKKAIPGRRPLAKRVLLNAVLLSVSGLVALGMAEVFLRVVPIPGIIYNSFCYDRFTGGGPYPGTKQIYRNAHNQVVKRKVNSWGFLDVEHARERRPGTVRIGFFGDSFTEARQVPIDSTFFRLIETGLNSGPATGTRRQVETLAFGVSGRSTLQSYLECARWMGPAELDVVVYDFVENDPIDQVRSLKRSDEIPYPILDGDSFVVDYSFRDRYGYKESTPHRALQYLKAHSLVVSTIETRLKYLRRHGIKLRVTQEDRSFEGAHVAQVKKSRRFHDDSDSLFVYTRTVFERVLDRWRTEVTAGGRKFVVLYIPAQTEMMKPVAEQDSWVGWLEDYCAAHGVPFVDTSSCLVASERAGVEVFYDHFTPAGHRCAADAFVSWYVTSNPE